MGSPSSLQRARLRLGHEQARAHVLVGLRVQLPQALEQCAQVVWQSLDFALVDLDADDPRRLAFIERWASRELLDIVVYEAVPGGETQKGYSAARAGD